MARSHAAELEIPIPDRLVRTSSLVDHYGICLGLLNRPAIDTGSLASVLVYLRLLATREARLSMNHNHQAKDIAHIQDAFSMALARAYVTTCSRSDDEAALQRLLLRSMVSLAPRGGGNGDELRLFVLEVMRRHGIREGHRPGIDDPFFEQWHQKLHSSSTAEDIHICEALIRFQETASHDVFYRTLWDRGGISIDYLRSLPHPLTHAPRYMPALIPDLKHLLWILKQVHGGCAHLDHLITVARWQLDGELLSLLESVRDDPGAWWVPGRIIECRQRLGPMLRAHTPRDPLMIDVALEGMYRTAVERLDHRARLADVAGSISFSGSPESQGLP